MLGVGDTRYFQFDTILSILPSILSIRCLFSIPILSKSETSIQNKHVDNIHIHTDR